MERQWSAVPNGCIAIEVLSTGNGVLGTLSGHTVGAEMGYLLFAVNLIYRVNFIIYYCLSRRGPAFGGLFSVLKHKIKELFGEYINGRQH